MMMTTGRASRPPERSPERSPERASRPPRPGETKARLFGVARVAAVALVAYAVTEALRGYLSQNAAAAAVLPGLLIEWIAGRTGVAWNDPNGPPAALGHSARRVARGASIALGLSACVVGALLVTRSGTVTKGELDVGEWLTGLVVASFVALRVELLAHGFVLRMLASSSSFWLRIACTSLLSIALSAAAGGSLATVCVRGMAGSLAGALWVVDRAGLRALGFRAAWSFLWSVVLHGSPLEITAPQGLFASKDGPGTGLFAGACLLAATVALAVIGRGRPNEVQAETTR
jgi:hypothetical protein